MNDIKSNEIKNEVHDIKKWKEKINWKNLKMKQKIHIWFSTIWSDKDWANLLENLVELNYKSKPKIKDNKNKKRDTYERVYALYEGQESFLNTFKMGIFPIKIIKRK